MTTAHLINGGLGRVICAIPALQRTNQFALLEGFAEPFIGTGIPALEASSVYAPHFLADKHINAVEPYHLLQYRNGDINMVEAFDLLINGDISTDVPKLYFDKAFQQQIRAEQRNAAKADNIRVAVMQPFGADKSHGGQGRDMTEVQVQQCIAVLKEAGFTVFLVGVEGQVDRATYPDAIKVVCESVSEYLHFISVTDYFVGCDSSGMHIARAANVPGCIFFGSTSGKKYYPDWFLEQHPSKQLNSTPRVSAQLEFIERYQGEGIMDYAVDTEALAEHIAESVR